MEKFLHALNVLPGSGYPVLKKLWDRFGSWEYIWKKADVFELAKTGLASDFVRRLINARRNFDVEREFASLWEADIVLLGRQHSEYPALLRQIDDAPFLLYRKGAALDDARMHVAVVGTRRPSVYGEKMAYELAEALATHDAVVVSGLALGIDAVSHFAAVSNRKPTIAVLASGLYKVTPGSHNSLAENILRNGGTILSEYPPADPPFKAHFLERNRIIAGLCKTTVVIEAGQRSGALVTGRRALDYNRDVFALPGDITRPQAAGCLQFIAAGAQPIISIQSFLDQLGISRPTNILENLHTDELQLIAAFESKSSSTDALLEKTLLSVPQLNALLTGLEIKGIIRVNRASMWELTIPRSP